MKLSVRDEAEMARLDEVERARRGGNGPSR